MSAQAIRKMMVLSTRGAYGARPQRLSRLFVKPDHILDRSGASWIGAAPSRNCAFVGTGVFAHRERTLNT